MLCTLHTQVHAGKIIRLCNGLFFIKKSYNKEKVTYNKYRKMEKCEKNRDMNSEETGNFKFGCLKKEMK